MKTLKKKSQETTSYNPLNNCVSLSAWAWASSQLRLLVPVLLPGRINKKDAMPPADTVGYLKATKALSQEEFLLKKHKLSLISVLQKAYLLRTSTKQNLAQIG